VELHADLDAPCPPEQLFSWIDDLERYPQWLGIVRRAEPVTSSGDAGSPPAWIVDLEAQLGPFARAKRLRMERRVCDPPRLVVFDRHELDGRDHGQWTLRGEVSATPTGSRLTMTLRYDGRLWGPAVAAVLHQEIERSRDRLLALVTVGA
jgi:hypothetical protein